jgi:hypothetical protein
VRLFEPRVTALEDIDESDGAALAEVGFLEPRLAEFWLPGTTLADFGLLEARLARFGFCSWASDRTSYDERRLSNML